MNTKRKLETLILIGGLAIMTWAFAQTAFKGDGIIQSTSGGFKFPDDSVQATAAQATAAAPVATEIRWIGPTTTGTNGDISASTTFGNIVGYAAMHYLCQVEVGSNARACFSDEVIRGRPGVFIGAQEGWVIPRFSFVYDPEPNTVMYNFLAVEVVSGISYPSRSFSGSALDQSCAGYTNGVSYYGFYGPTASGMVSRALCNTPRKIACCAPVALATENP